MIIVIHFNPSRSFLQIFVSGIAKKRALYQNKNANKLLTKMLEIVLTPKLLGPPKLGTLGLSLYSLMVNPRLNLLHL